MSSSRVGVLVSVRVQTRAYTAHREAIVVNLWFTGKSRSKMAFHNVNSQWGWGYGLECWAQMPSSRSDLVVVEGEG